MTKVFLKKLSFAIISVSMFAACGPKKNNHLSADVPDVPNRAPNYSKSSNNDLAYLGRVLFYDKKLSSDNSIRCASCHEQSKAFADDKAFSQGVGGLTHRNAPSIFPKNGRMFWDGRAKDLNDMVIMPISNEVEMNIQNYDELCDKLSTTIYYPTLFKRAFKDEKVTKERIRMALAEFVKNFDFSDNRFKASQGILGKKLSDNENSGKDLFFGKAKCAQCHHIDSRGMGGGSGSYGHTDESHNIGLEAQPIDKGCGDFEKNNRKDGQFMMPVLLNVELTAPYMHDGSLATLEDVVEHYNSKVVKTENLDFVLTEGNGNPQQLNLSATEKSQLVSFLKTLTDKNILTDSKFSDPFAH